MTVVMIPFRTMVKIKVVGNHHAAFAGRHRLDVVKTETAHISEAAQFFTFKAGTASLGVVF